MKAMILAAGYGKRMGELTQYTPKPLLEVAGKPLLQYRLEALKQGGMTQVVINHGWLGEQIEAYFTDGRDLGLSITWSREGTPLNTGSGIINALPLLGDEPFILCNADIWTDYMLADLCHQPLGDFLAHLILVDNPEHNKTGDFSLYDGIVCSEGDASLTYSGMALLNPALFTHFITQTNVSLGDVLRWAIKNKKVSGSYYNGQWVDIGTAERLQQINSQVKE